MSLHPDNRPKNVIEFRDALLGKQEAPTRPEFNGASFDMPNLTVFTQEQIAVYTVVGLFLIGLIATLAR
jgi:hypothetical protein